MLDGSLTLPQQMPESFLGSESSGYEVGADSLEIQHRNPHESYVDHLTESRYESSAAATVAVRQFQAQPASELAAVADVAARNLLYAREREIAKDLSSEPRHSRVVEPSMLEKAAEIAFGKKVVSRFKKINTTFSDPYQRHLQAERNYQRREAIASQRVLGDKHQQFFCSDRHTWDWHKFSNDDVTPDQTVRYHVRPDGVLKQVSDGHFSRVTGQELDNFGALVRSYYNELQASVYNQVA